MMAHGIFKTVHQEIGQIIVTEINPTRVLELLDPDRVAIAKLIAK
jgi:isocitrate lyase